MSSERNVEATHYSLTTRFLYRNCTKWTFSAISAFQLGKCQSEMDETFETPTTALLSQPCIHRQNPANSANFEAL